MLPLAVAIARHKTKVARQPPSLRQHGQLQRSWNLLPPFGRSLKSMQNFSFVVMGSLFKCFFAIVGERQFWYRVRTSRLLRREYPRHGQQRCLEHLQYF